MNAAATVEKLQPEDKDEKDPKQVKIIKTSNVSPVKSRIGNNGFNTLESSHSRNDDRNKRPKSRTKTVIKRVATKEEVIENA